MVNYRYISTGIAGAVLTSYVIYQVFFHQRSYKKKTKKEGEEEEKRNDVFSRACDKVKELDGLDTNIQLQLYGLFKQATKGKCTAPQPWASDFRGRAKWDAWKKNGDMSKEDAESAYVSLVHSLVPESLEQDKSKILKKKKKKKKSASQGMGLSVSTMMKEEIEDDREDDVFVFCSKGATEKVLDLVCIVK